MLYIFGDNKDLRQKIKTAAVHRQHIRANPGGSVWETRAEVETHIAKNQKTLPPGLGIFGVKADWAKDTYPAKERLARESKGEDSSYITWRDLAKKSIIVALPSNTSGLVKAEEES